MKLDPTVMHNMKRQDYRVLSSVERGMKYHALVPTTVITSISSLRYGGTHKILSSLLRDKLLSHDRSCGYDGYRLTTSGHDILSLNTLKNRGIVSGLGDRIGTGKESDVYIATIPYNDRGTFEGKKIVLKFHRLGRTSFRDVRSKRSYHIQSSPVNGKSEPAVNAHSWLFLSQKSAQKEYEFLKALKSYDYNTPHPIAIDRHVVAMDLVNGVPLYKVCLKSYTPYQVKSIYDQGMNFAVRLAHQGLVHCDLHEFNLLVDVSKSDKESNCTGNENLPLEDGSIRPIVTMIDFPQMVSVNHPNARDLWEHDVKCLWKFFVNKCKCWTTIQFENLELPFWGDVTMYVNEKEKENGFRDLSKSKEYVDLVKKVTSASNIFPSISENRINYIRLDVVLKASGFEERDNIHMIDVKNRLSYYHKINSDTMDNIFSFSENRKKNDKKIIHDDSISDNEHNRREKMNSGQILSDNKIDGSKEDKNEQEMIGSLLTSMSISKEHLKSKARLRVQQHLKYRRKQRERKNAFCKPNRNKKLSSGKCVF